MQLKWMSPAHGDGDHIAYDPEMRKLLEEVHDEAMKNFLEKAKLDDREKRDLCTYAVRVLLNNRMRSCAGRAQGVWQIDIHYRLFSEGKNRAELINTYVHELAHIVCSRIYSQIESGHGVMWRAVMTLMGHEPTRTHKMDVKEFKAKPAEKNYVYLCPTASCANDGQSGREYRLTKHKHQKHIKWNGRVYSCRICKKYIVFKEKVG